MRTSSKKVRFLQIIIDSIAIPIILFVVVQLVSNRNNFFLKYLDLSIINIIDKFKSISFLWMSWLGFARFVNNLGKLLVDDGLFKISNDRTIINTISKALMSIAYIIMLLMLLNIFGLSVTKILTLVGGPAAIFLFAGKTAITDVIGGVSMLMNKSFVVGEEIEIPEKNFKGQILKIGLKKMTLRTIDNKILTLPNSILSTVSIINRTRSKHEQIVIEFFIEPDCYKIIPEVITQIKESIHKRTDINKKLSVSVCCNRTTSLSSLILEIKVYTNTTRLDIVTSVKQDIFLKTLDILNVNNCYLKK
ncbi:MAG: mechanosensitive ion channel [Cytophagales bacterium]|nr:mechanosensitive ion channel [Cytophagales bacterium]